MGFEEKDFIIRQIKQLAQGLGTMLNLKSVKELINYEQNATDALSDEEIENVLLITEVEERLTARGLSAEAAAGALGLTPETWEELRNFHRLPSEAEREVLFSFSGKGA